MKIRKHVKSIGAAALSAIPYMMMGYSLPLISIGVDNHDYMAMACGIINFFCGLTLYTEKIERKVMNQYYRLLNELHNALLAQQPKKPRNPTSRLNKH